MGFAASCMIWMVVAEVLPDAFKEAYPSQVASTACFSVAFMEALSAMFQNFSSDYASEHVAGLIISLFFCVGPLLGGSVVIGAVLTLRLRHPFLLGTASGIGLILALWRPLQLHLSSQMALVPLGSLLATGATLSHFASSILCPPHSRKTSASNICPTPRFTSSAHVLQSLFSCATIGFHALCEGLALGVAAPKAYGPGQHIVLPVLLHGIPRGAAAASCVYGATSSWHKALTASAAVGLAGPFSSIAAIIAGIDYGGLDYIMVLACGVLFPGLGRMIRRASRLDTHQCSFGLILGLVFALSCLLCSKIICTYTPCCNSAPDAIK